MSYMALYRKWRPNNFDEIQGQDAIVQTLRNQILYDRIGHAYLFCGTRGTGKTSIAKLFAKAVNCQNPVNGNPCNACPSCLAVNRQNSLDVMEIDAASNNGVDHIREIREQVQYSPVEGKYKVYIIDEVHMLSSGAFNALLKTLEEPPSYVIFILATTEKHKIPVTILSRCQKYDFKRISVDTITGYLSVLMEKEGIDAETKALRYIAGAADGSMRDALSLLDQCIAFYLNQKLTYDNVLEVLGTVDTSVFSRLLRHVLAGETGEVLSIIGQMIGEGRELSQFLSDFLWYLRNLLLLKDQEGAEDSLDLSSEAIAGLREEAALVETSTLLRYIRVLSDLSSQLRNATQKRILLEVGFIRLCTPQMETDDGSLLERLRLLEKRMEHGVPVMTAAPQPDLPPTPKPPSRETALASLEKRFSPAQAADLKQIASEWNRIVSQTAMPMQRFLQAARIAVSQDSNIIQLLFEHDGIEKGYFEKNHQQNLEILSDFVAQKTGKKIKFECAVQQRNRTQESNYIDLSKIHLPVTFE
ncbi:MAG: DNA polymerase III subunit gamma/tau [Eubacteriales bacterium]|nr:DNA polymerase III subunit gamma/tau [Eubacteriales bacterium]